jgi:GTPase
MKALPKVIIIGRANVGKSTLFNRLIEKPKALTSKLAGTTRDINIGQIYWQGINFEMIDTGGIETIVPSKKLKKLSPELNENFALDIINQTQAALKEADLILFVVDIQAGLLPQDKGLSNSIKKLNKEVIFVANKTDSRKLENKVGDFFKLGLGQPLYVSAINGAGTGDLLDEIIIKLKKIKKSRKANKREIKNPIKMTILGKPNVGKSSLLNSILGEQRVIVSPLAFTTREAIDTHIVYKKKNIILVDTAGIRKQARVKKGLEKISVNKSLQNAKHSEICFLVVDISKPITVQDNKLSKILIDSQVSLIFVANKWDQIQDLDTKSQKKYEEHIYKMFPYLTWAPIIFTSALTGKNTNKVLDLAMEVYEARQIKLNDNVLNKFLKQAMKKNRPKAAKGVKQPYLQHLTQIRVNPPTFQVKIGFKDSLNNAYLKYLTNALRGKFKIIGTPVKIIIKK